MKNEKHEFAFFCVDVARLLQKNATYDLQNPELVNRITSIVRLGVGDSLILFNQEHHVHAEIVAISKKTITIRTMKRTDNTLLMPNITWFLPLLERDAFEEALTALTVMGVQEIYPLITEKSKKSWGNEKERDRAHRVMIAACEQSKQFCVPFIHKAITCEDLASIVAHHNFGHTIFFDTQGTPTFDVIQDIKRQKISSLACYVGPEGDFTKQEKEIIKKLGCRVCVLTPTILRASVAVQVGAGLLRSCL